MAAPPVAVTVTVNVPVGVIDELPECPLHPAIPSTAPNKITIAGIASRSIRFRPIIIPSIPIRQTIPSIPASQLPGGILHATTGATPAIFTFVAIVSIVLAASPFGVTVAGLNVHVEKFGNPEQVKLVDALYPFFGVTVIVVIAVPPAFTVPLAGLNATVKSGAAVTVTFTAVELDVA